MNYVFGIIPDIDTEILLNLHGKKLFRACTVNKYISGLCNPWFWKRKFIKEYGADLGSLKNVDYQAAYKFMYVNDPVGQLLWAVDHNYYELVRILLENNEYADKYIEKLLYNASRMGFTEIVKLLLDSGADIHADNDRALRLSGKPDTVKLLLDRGANIHSRDDVALRWTAENGHTDTVKLLLDRGADIHVRDDYALRRASEKGYKDTVKVLLDRGANIHADNDYALRYAALNGKTGTVALLLDRGADIHSKDDFGLRLAAENGHTNTVKLLLDRGADIHALDDQALRLAAKNGHTETVALLLVLTAGANPNKISKSK